jgi:hypothetical protein
MTVLSVPYQTLRKAKVTPYFHRFQFALMQDDVLALVTYPKDQNTPIELVEAFTLTRVDHSPIFKWEIESDSGETVTGTRLAQVHPYLRLGAASPYTLVNKARGVCTIFMVEVKRGYNIFQLEYLAIKAPHIYKQLTAS